jgi:hypothetical protein
MTALVGVNCRDGVVIGADSSATSVIEFPTEKLFILNQRAILATTGSVGLAQRLHETVTTLWNTPEYRDAVLAHSNIANTVARMALTNFLASYPDNGRPQVFECGALMAFSASDGTQLCEFGGAHFQPEFKNRPIWFAGSGSGATLTEPFLAFISKLFWEHEQPSLSDGIFAATWALDHVIDLNTGGVNGPVRMAVLEGRGRDARARMLEAAELQEHRQYIEEAKQVLRGFRAGRDPGGAAIPDVPRPPNP